MVDDPEWADRHGRTLIVVEDVSFMIATGIVGFPDAHGVVGKVDIAVIT